MHSRLSHTYPMGFHLGSRCFRPTGILQSAEGQTQRRKQTYIRPVPRNNEVSILWCHTPSASRIGFEAMRTGGRGIPATPRIKRLMVRKLGSRFTTRHDNPAIVSCVCHVVREAVRAGASMSGGRCKDRQDSHDEWGNWGKSTHEHGGRETHAAQ